MAAASPLPRSWSGVRDAATAAAGRGRGHMGPLGVPRACHRPGTRARRGHASEGGKWTAGAGNGGSWGHETERALGLWRRGLPPCPPLPCGTRLASPGGMRRFCAPCDSVNLGGHFSVLVNKSRIPCSDVNSLLTKRDCFWNERSASLVVEGTWLVT